MDENKIRDVVIVGAGPAGVSCAVWLARLGFEPVLLEASSKVGGLCLDHPFSDGWNATLPEMTGPEVARNLARSLELAQVEPRFFCRVGKIEPGNGCWQVFYSGSDVPLQARHVVLATGVRARGLTRSSRDDDVLPAGVLVGPGTAIVEQDFRDKRVAVLGGGDNAFENALYAMERGARDVVIFARTVRAQQQFVQRFPTDKVVVGSCEVAMRERQVNGWSWDLLLVFYGWEARVPATPGRVLSRTSHGFVEVDHQTTETCLPNIYAIGEVAQRMHPCVVTALADGVTAAKVIQARLENIESEALA